MPQPDISFVACENETLTLIEAEFVSNGEDVHYDIPLPEGGKDGETRGRGGKRSTLNSQR